MKEQAYKYIIRPTLKYRYACSVWDSYNKGEIGQLEMVWRGTARIVSNRQRKRPSVGDMLQHLKWRTIEHSYKDALLDLMYAIANEKVAILKNDIIEPLLRQSQHAFLAFY